MKNILTTVSSKLIAQITVFSIITCGLLGSLAFWNASSTLDKQIRETLTYRTEIKSHELSAKLDSYISQVEKISSDSRIKSMDWNYQQPLLIKKTNELGFSSMSVSDTNGNMRLSGGGVINIGGTENFKKVMVGSASISVPIISKADGKSVLVPVSVPIFDDENNVIGLLASNMSSDFIYNTIKDIKEGRTGYAFIVTRDGNIIADNKDNKNYAQTPYNLLKDEDGTVYQKALEEKYGFKNFKENGTEMYMSYSPIGDTGWVLFVKVPEEEVEGSMQSLFLVILGVTIIAMLLSVLFALLIADGIKKPLKSMAVYAEELSKNNLSYRMQISEKDEFGRVAELLNGAMEKLQSMVNSVKYTETQSNGLTNIMSQKIAKLNERIKNVSSGAKEISTSMEESSTSIEAINEQVQKTKKYGEKIRSQSKDSVIIAANIKNSADKVVNDSGRIQKEISAIYESSKEKLDEALTKVEIVKKISEMANNINTIASQTNLLALNAAIEAARAGEQGKGFAVVADEVRKLAEQSSKTASGIQETIMNVVSSVEELTETSKYILESMKESMNENHEKMLAISKGYNKDGETIKEMMDKFESETKQISEALDDVSLKINELLVIFEDVSVNSNEIASEISSINKDTQDVSNISVESAKFSEKLSVEVGNFKTN